MRTITPRPIPAILVVFALAAGYSLAFPSHNRNIAFHAKPAGVSTHEIYSTQPDGGNTVRLTNNSIDDIQPTYSPGGGYIAFVRPVGGVNQIHTMASDGSGVVQVTDGGSLAEMPQWSPDGTKLLFIHASDIWTIPANGSASPTLVYGHPSAPIPRATWSASGTHIYYWHGGGVTSVYRITSGGQDAETITPGAHPSVSPDGTYLAYELGADIYKIHLSTDTVTRLTNSSTDQKPVWSPDGTRILFNGGNRGGHSGSKLFTLDPSGLNMDITYLETGVSGNNVAPDWQACAAITSCPGGAECGTIPNGCGEDLPCGSCILPEVCGLGGVENVCVHPCDLCSPTESCVSNQCASCSTTVCGSSPNQVCVDTSNDYYNCGGCGQVCSGAQTCQGGQCVGCADSAETSCSGQCVNTSSNVNHCGGCGQVCPPIPQCFKACIWGECVYTGINCDEF